MKDGDSRGTSCGHPPLKSKAWAHFTRVKDGDPNSPKASCNYCGRSYKCHSKKQGTSSMLYHLTICKHYRARQNRLAASKSKLICELKKDGDSTTGSLAIDKCVEKKIGVAIARMIIVDGLPFRFVEGQGFRDFMRTIDSKFPIPSCITVMRDCVKLYLLEKEKLRNLFTTSGQRVCLTTTAVLDPRYKLDALEFWFTEVVGIEQATELVAKLRRVIDRLYDQYTKFGGDVCGVELSGAEPQSSSISINSSKQGFLNFMSRYYKIRTSQNNVGCKSELDQYLTDDIEAPNENFDILNWWKVKSTKFPILAHIAKVVLAVPISTIDSESSFSADGQVLDHFRSSLSPTAVEAIICAQNWLKEAPPIAYDTRDVMVDAESYKLESEISLRNILHDDD
ncbi:hypothetical protein F2P56_032496 [Juglans regia]|nr:hypothetical protein F2P56_032496 [Juglans regia]